MSIDDVTFGPWMYLGREVEIPQYDHLGNRTFPTLWWSRDGRRVEVRGRIREKVGRWSDQVSHYCLFIMGSPEETWMTREEAAEFMVDAVRGDEAFFNAQRPFGIPEYLKRRGITLPEEARSDPS